MVTHARRFIRNGIRNLLPAAVLLAGMAAAEEENSISDHVQLYLASGRGIVTLLGTENPSSATIVSTVDGMLENAKPVLVQYGKKHPQCAAQVAKIIEFYPQIATWTAAEIRSNIEGAAALPPAEGCYAGRDVIAHPSIVRALARPGIAANQRARLIREIKEGIEHMEEIGREFE